MGAILNLWAGMTGAIMPYALSTPPETNDWLLCDGQVLDEDSPHQVLRAKLIADGMIYGDDGDGNPKIPDLRGEFIRGLDAGRGVDAGRTLGSAQGSQNREHGHTLTLQRSKGEPGTDMPPVNAGNNTLPFNANGMVVDYTVDTTSNSAIVQSGGAEARPRNVALNFIIKT